MMDQGNVDKNKEAVPLGNEQPAQNTAFNDFSNIINNFDVNKFVSVINKLNKNISAENIVLKKNDSRIEVLNFLKDFLPQDKKIIIDQVIDAFSEKGDKQKDPSPDKPNDS